MSTVKKRPAPPPKPGHLSIRTVSQFTTDNTITRGNAHKTRPNIDTSFYDGHVSTQSSDQIATLKKTSSPSSSRKSLQDLFDIKLSYIADSEEPRDDGYATSDESKATQLPARALYSFNAKTSKELSISAGDEFIIYDFNVADGWYMARKDEKQGLVPSTFITLIQDFTIKPDEAQETLAMPLDLSQKKRDDDTLSIYSVSSMTSTISTPQPQKSVRQSFFGKRVTLFGSSTSALEDFVEHGNIPPREQEQSLDNERQNFQIAESDQHNIASGPQWSEKTPVFNISVCSPRRIISRSSEYVLYKVSSTFSNDISVTVDRRFSQFQWLQERLQKKFAYLVLPTLPEKQYSSRTTDVFIEQRRRALETYMKALVRHPVIRYSNLLTHFLSCDEEDWKQHSAFLSKDEHIGSHFFHGLEFPDFNVDEEGDQDVLEHFMNHITEMDKKIPEVLETHDAHARIVRDGANRYRNMSHALLRMMEQSNSDGAWCWREGCIDCLHFSKALQTTAETYLSLADDHEHYANQETDLLIHDITAYTKSSAAHSPLLDTHKSTLKQLQVADQEDEDLRYRCEAVFNVVSAETDRFHEDRLTDWRDMTDRSLDAQIALYEKMASKLKAARATLGYTVQSSRETMDPPSPRNQTINLDNVRQCKLDPPLACGIAPVVPSETLMDTQATVRRVPPPLVSSESASSSESSSPSSTTTPSTASASASSYTSVLGTVSSVASIFAVQDTKPSRPSVRSSIFESWWGNST